MGAIFTTIWVFLKKIKPIYILAIALVCMTFLTYTFYKSSQLNKREKERIEKNFKEEIEFKDSAYAELNFTTNKEIQEYIDSRETLKKLYEDQEEKDSKKIKRLLSLIYQQNIYIDTLKTKQDVSPIIEYIKQDIAFVEKWTDSTACSLIKGQLVFENDSLYSEITLKRFENEMLLSGYLERPQKNWFTRRFGRLEGTTTVTSTCGESKTIKINRVKKGSKQ